MKSKRSPVIIIIIVVALLAALLAYYYNDRKKYNWEESYEQKSKEPFGTHIIAELLKERTPDHKINFIDKPLREALKKGKYVTPSNYIIFGHELYTDSAGINNLLNYVAEGNNVFICSNTFPGELMEELYDYKCLPEWEGTYSLRDSNVSFNFYHDELKSANAYNLKLIVRGQKKAYNWSYVAGSFFCDSAKAFVHLGYMQTVTDSYVNFFSAEHGKGTFYFHTTPITFTNYFMIQDSVIPYAGAVFSHLDKRAIYWDEHNKIYEYENDGVNNNAGESPLKFILSQTPLRWAWYILLSLVVVYLLFRVKRRQRIIPLLSATTNTSLEFIKTVGRFYFLQNNHQKLCDQKMKQFLIFIRNRYGLSTSKLDAVFITRLHEKSELPYDEVAHIIKQHDWLSVTSTGVTNEELIAFHQKIEHFYKNCK